jgi:hypothetical protein
MKNRIINGDAIFAFCMLVMSATFFVMGAAFDRPTADGQLHEGFFPQLIAAFVGIMSILIIINAIRKKPAYFAMDDKQKEGVKTLLKITGLFIAYVIAWQFVHFIISTLLLLGIMCRVFKLRWKFTAIFSTVFSVGIYFLFTKLFSILL